MLQANDDRIHTNHQLSKQAAQNGLKVTANEDKSQALALEQICKQLKQQGSL
jgi:hypothetical protein